MGIKRKIFEFIKCYKLTEPSSDFVVYHCMWRGKKRFSNNFNDARHVWNMITLPTYTIWTVVSSLLQLLNFQIKDFIYLCFVPYR